MKNLAEKQTAFIPNIQLCIGFVFSVGVLACVGLLLGALIAAAYLLNLTVAVLVETGQHIADLYQHSDPTMQLLMLIIIGYCIFQASRKAFHLKKSRGVQ
jgi:hypothetical protein